MIIYVIVENILAYDSEVRGDIHECLCHSLGYFSDANLAEAKVEELNRKWRVDYVEKYDRQSLRELAEKEDIYPLLDALQKWGCFDAEDRDRIQDELERYGFIPMNPANYVPKRIVGRKIV